MHVSCIIPRPGTTQQISRPRQPRLRDAAAVSHGAGRGSMAVWPRIAAPSSGSKQLQLMYVHTRT